MEERIFNPNGEQTYAEFKAAQYPGFKLRGSDAITREMYKVKKDLDARRDRLNALIKSGKGLSSEAVAAQGLFDEAEKRFKNLEKALTSGEVFTNLSVEDQHFIPIDPDFSFGNMVGRQAIDANRSRIPQENYTNYGVAEEVTEGGNAEPVSLTDSLSMVLTNTDDAIIFDDIQEVMEHVYNDDREVMEAAVDSVHDKRFINAENKKALEILIGSKDAIAVTAEGVQEAINANLCGKAKRNAVIMMWYKKS